MGCNHYLGQLNLHLSEVAKSSTSFGWGKGGKVTAVVQRTTHVADTTEQGISIRLHIVGEKVMTAVKDESHILAVADELKRNEPCSTLQSICDIAEELPFMTMACERSARYDQNHSRAWLSMPNLCRNTINMIEWSTVSIALLRSSRMSAVTRSASAANKGRVTKNVTQGHLFLATVYRSIV